MVHNPKTSSHHPQNQPAPPPLNIDPSPKRIPISTEPTQWQIDGMIEPFISSRLGGHQSQWLQMILLILSYVLRSYFSLVGQRWIDLFIARECALWAPLGGQGGVVSLERDSLFMTFAVDEVWLVIDSTVENSREGEIQCVKSEVDVCMCK